MSSDALRGLRCVQLCPASGKSHCKCGAAPSRGMHYPFLQVATLTLSDSTLVGMAPETRHPQLTVVLSRIRMFWETSTAWDHFRRALTPNRRIWILYYSSQKRKATVMMSSFPSPKQTWELPHGSPMMNTPPASTGRAVCSRSPLEPLTRGVKYPLWTRTTLMHTERSFGRPLM